MADQSENEVQFNSDLGGTLTIVSPFHSELDIKPENDHSINSDEQKFADVEGIFIWIVLDIQTSGIWLIKQLDFRPDPDCWLFDNFTTVF